MYDYAIATHYFKALRSEIITRINNHIILTIGKIVCCIVSLFFLIEYSMSTISFILVPFLAISIDLIIQHNIRSINNIGKYIRDEIEGKIFNDINVTSSIGKLNLYEQKAQSEDRGIEDLFTDRLGQIVVSSIFSFIAWSQTNYSLLVFVITFILLAVDVWFMKEARAGD